MVLSGSSDVVDFDAESAVSAVRDALGDDLLLAVEYDRTNFNVLYAADSIVSRYDDLDAMREQFARIHAYVYLDFVVRTLFEDLFDDTGGVRAFSTHMGNYVAVRVLADEDGLFLTLAPDANPTVAVEAVRGTV